VLAAVLAWSKLFAGPAAAPPTDGPAAGESLEASLSRTLLYAEECRMKGLLDHALAGYERVVAVAKDAKEPEVRRLGAQALRAAAEVLQAKGDQAGARAMEERLTADFPEAPRTARSAGIGAKPTTAKRIPFPARVGRIAIADVNGDGRPDVIGAGAPGWFALSRQDGGFTSAAWPGGEAAAPVKGALLGAGDVDLAGVAAWFTAGDAPGEMHIWRMDKATHAIVDEKLAPSPAIAQKGWREYLACTADFCGSGTPDLVCWKPNEEDAVVRRGVIDLPGGKSAAPGSARSAKDCVGTLLFPEERVLGFDRIVALDVARLSGVKFDDIVALGDDTKSAARTDSQRERPILFYRGNPGFQEDLGATHFVTPDVTKDLFMAIGDVSGDRIADVVTNDYRHPTEGRVLTHVAQKTPGYFEPASDALDLPDSCDKLCATIADVDGDGKGDLIVIDRAGPSAVVCVYLSNGDGTFREGPHTAVSNMKDVRLCAAADMDGDGKVDLVLYEWGEAIAVLRGDGTGAFRGE
jgi:hypothetical protein